MGNLKPEGDGDAEGRGEAPDSGLRSQPSALDPAAIALAAAERDPHTPRCVARAFLAERTIIGPIEIGPVTLRAWLRLESVGSPWVTGEFPESPEGDLHALCTALASMAHLHMPGLSAAHLTPALLSELLSPEHAFAARQAVDKYFEEAFSTVLSMRPPVTSETPAKDEGFGWWTRLMVWLVQDFGMTVDAALDTPVCQAFVLVATARANYGWQPKGMNYAEREALEGID